MERSIAPVNRPAVDTERVGFSYHPGSEQVLVVFHRGYKDGDGRFVLVEQQEIVIVGADYKELLAANVAGKKEGRFRNDDVLAMADRIKGR